MGALFPAPEPRGAEAPPEATALVVRPATAADLDAVMAIERASFGDPWPDRAFADSLRDAGLSFLVASVGGEVAGYVIAWFVVDEGEIANLAVRPASRGRGIGKALLDAALGLGRARGTLATFLEVRESNVVARALYASRRFEEIGRRRVY